PPFKWRGFWDFGTGALGDMACHIMDAAYWTLDLGYPTRIEAESTPLFKETAPAGSRISYTFAAKGKRPEVKVVWRDGSLYPPRPAEVADELAWPFDQGGGLSSMVLLGCLAVRLGRPLEVNPENGQVTNVTIPDEYIHPHYRSGWSL